MAHKAYHNISHLFSITRLVLTVLLIMSSLSLTNCSLPSNATRNRLAKNLPSTIPSHIALLLPLSGPLKSQAVAIRNGFFATYYQQKAQGINPSIKVYDSHRQDIVKLYQRAIKDGADFIVGPLTKNHLRQLINHQKITVPTLALNSIAISSANKSLYQFGLSPTDEVLQAADKMYSDRYQRIMMIIPQNSWGAQLGQRFQQRWQKLGGNIVTTVSYTNQTTLARKLRAALDINQSTARYRELKSVLRQKTRFIARRRQDIDAIFLIANPSMGRQIVPLLRFYYAGNLPVYATSTIYQGKPSPRLDHDLNGVIFNDMPWLLVADNQLPSQTEKLRHSIKTIWPHSYRRHRRLYALGIDAFNLISQLKTLVLSPQSSFAGTTGTLYLMPNHHLYRQLLWAKINHGRPQLTS